MGINRTLHASRVFRTLNYPPALVPVIPNVMQHWTRVSKQKSTVKKKIIIISIVLILVIFTGFLSRSLSIKAGNKLIEPVKGELQLVGCRPCRLQFEDGHPVSKTTGIGWRVAYNTDKYFIINDIEVYTSLTGKIVATNPTNLKSRIRNRSK